MSRVLLRILETPQEMEAVEELQRRHRLYREMSLAAGRSEAEVEALESRAWGMRVVHVAPDRAEALRATEAPFMGYQRKMSVLRSDATGGTVPGSFNRSLLRLRTFREYLDDGWALIGAPAEVREGLRRLVLAVDEVAPRGEIQAHHPPVAGRGPVDLDVGQSVLPELHGRVAHRLGRDLAGLLKNAREALVVVPVDFPALEGVHELLAASDDPELGDLS